MLRTNKVREGYSPDGCSSIAVRAYACDPSSHNPIPKAVKSAPNPCKELEGEAEYAIVVVLLLLFELLLSPNGWASQGAFEYDIEEEERPELVGAMEVGRRESLVR